MNLNSINIVDYPAKHLIGMKVFTSMPKAQADCPALWQTFGPRIAELYPSCSECKGSYGISVMVSEQDFYYWAAVEVETTADIPSGMERIDITAGPYATCTAPSLEKIGEAYALLYEAWPKSQPEYTFAMAPCFEFYGPNWQLTDPLDVFMPLKRK